MPRINTESQYGLSVHAIRDVEILDRFNEIPRDADSSGFPRLIKVTSNSQSRKIHSQRRSILERDCDDDNDDDDYSLSAEGESVLIYQS